MKVIAIGSLVKPISDEQRLQIMPREVPHTLKLYLEGTLEQFWYVTDDPGVVFLMSVESVEQAKTILNGLPLVIEGFAKYEVKPVAPLAPLGFLLNDK